jgi:hypothetical protein
VLFFNKMVNPMNRRLKLSLALAGIVIGSTSLSSCFVAPLRVAMPLHITVEDADTGAPVQDAKVLYIASDIHDYFCKEGRVVHTKTNINGQVDISGKWKFGIWVIAPGGLPAPQHIVAISAEGYSTYLFGQYEFMKSRQKSCDIQSDIVKALTEIPQDNVVRDSRQMPDSELNGSRIKLNKSK